MDNKQSVKDYVEENYSYLSEHNKREEIKHQEKLRLEAEEFNKLFDELTPKIDEDLPVEANLIVINEVSGIKGATDTASSIIVDEIITPASKYAFPTPELEIYKEWESEDILENLDSLSQTANKMDQYLISREAYCALSVELNSRGLVAPAFRPSPTIPYLKNARKPSHTLIQRDRIVIDCHWLHARREIVYLSESKWRGILNMSKDFSFERVSEFASQKIKNEYRATAIMGLTKRQQLQMLALRSEEMQELYGNLYKSIREPGKKRQPPKLELIEMAINQWCEANSRMTQHRSQYVALAKAIELTGKSSPAQLGELMGLMLGVPPLAESTVRQKIIKLRKVLVKYATL